MQDAGSERRYLITEVSIFCSLQFSSKLLVTGTKSLLQDYFSIILVWTEVFLCYELKDLSPKEENKKEKLHVKACLYQSCASCASLNSRVKH